MSFSNNSQASGKGSNSKPPSAAARAGSYFLSLWRKTSSDPKQPQVFVCEHCQQEHLTQENAVLCEANCCKKPPADENTLGGLLLSDEVMAFECEICKKLYRSEAEAEACEAQCQSRKESLEPGVAKEVSKVSNSPVEKNIDDKACTSINDKFKDKDDDNSSSSSSSSDEDDDVLDLQGIRSLAQPSDVAESAEPMMGLNAGFTQTMGELPFSLDQDDPLFQQPNDFLDQEAPGLEPSSIDMNREKDRSGLDSKATSNDPSSIGEKELDTTGNTPDNPHRFHALDNSAESLSDRANDNFNINSQPDDSVAANIDSILVDWDSMFDRLRRFQTEFGHLYVREEKEPELHAWMVEQRKALGGKLLSGETIESETERERVVRLESIAFPWVDGLLSSDWNSMYDELVKFHREAGHTNVPGGLIRLCNWVKCQRNYLTEKRKKDDCNENDLEAISRLDKLGIQWPLVGPKRLLPSSEESEKGQDGLERPSSKEDGPQSGLDGMGPLEMRHKVVGQDADELSMTSADSSEEDLPRGHPETFRHSWLLEREAMRKIKLDILKQQEVQFMEMCQFDISRQEEEEVMTMIRQDIEVAETQRAAEILERSRPRASEVLEVSFVENGTEKAEIIMPSEVPAPLFQISVEWGTSPGRGAFDESEAYRCAKIIPKSYFGFPFFDGEEDRARVAKSIATNCLVRVLNIDHDPTACVIVIICDQWESAYCLDQLNSWLKRRRMRVIARILTEKGREIAVDWDTCKQAKLGITLLANTWERKKLLMVPRANAEVMEPLREVMKHGCVLLEAVNGIQMDTTLEFKEYITPKVQAGETIRLSCKVFDASLRMHDNVDGNSTIRIMDEEDVDAGMEVADDESGVHSSTQKPQDDETPTNNEASAAVPTKEVNVPGSTDDQPQRNAAPSIASYNHFKSKFKRLAELEFSESGIHVNKVISHMWTNHKKLLGSHCDDFCSCPYEVHELCKDTVRDILKKNPAWNNPLGLRAGDIPIGFAYFFCPKLLPYLRDENPERNPRQHLDLLCRMWMMHESNMVFGTKCSRNCECETAWDTLFRKVGKRKRGSRVSASTTELNFREREISKRQKRIPDEPHDREMTKEMRKKRRAEYCVAFKTKDPLGFYFMNEQRKDGQYCVVNSVFPLLRDERIRRGTTVVAVERKNGGRILIDSYEKLRNLYCLNKSTGDDIRIIFINLQDDDDLEAVRGHKRIDTDVWTKNGKWKGRSNLGWPGGAPLLRRQIRSSQITAHGPTEPESQHRAPARALPTPKASFMSRTTEPSEEWTKSCIPRRLLQKRPRSIIAGARGKADRPRRLQFSKTENETRQFEALWPASHFLVKSKTRQTSPALTSEPRIAGSAMTKRQNVNSHNESTKRFMSAVNESPIGANEAIQNQQNFNLPRDNTTQTAKSPAELARLLPQAVDSGTFLGLLQLLQDGAAVEMDSSKPIKSLLEIVKPKKEMGIHDFVMKDKILKCWFTTIEIASSAAALKHMSRVFISAQKVTISDPSLVELEAGEDLAISWLVRGRNRARKDCSRSISFPAKTEFIFPVASQTRPFEFTWNGDMESDSQIEVSILCENKFTGEKRRLGSGSKRIQDIFKRSQQNVVQIDISCCSRCTIVAEVVVTDFRLSEIDKFHKILRDKRSDLCRGLNKTVLDTIERFNNEMESHWGKQAYLSVEVPASGTNLLEIAIKLADDKSVKRLLKMGAKVTKRILEFAEAERLSPPEGCGALLASIVDFLKDHYNSEKEPAVPAQGLSTAVQSRLADESERVANGPEFSRVGRDWLFSLDKTIYRKCNNLERDGYCRFGSTCFFGHVCQPDVLKSSSLFPPREFKDHRVEIRTVHDKWGEVWYTAGCQEGNSFYYSWRKGGIQHKPTGIWWYKTRENAIQAVKSLVVGEDDSSASTQLPDPNFTLM